MRKTQPPTRRRRRIEWAFLALAAVFLMAACGAPSRPAPTAEPLECEQLDYPCRLSEVALPLLQQSMDLAKQSAQLLMDGSSVDEVMAFLAEVPGMASVEGAGEAVIFRLGGARPTVVDLQIDQPLLPQAPLAWPSPANDWAGQLRSGPPAHGSAPLRPSRVVGGGGDKSALVLAAFPFDFAGADSAAYVAALLEATPDYAGRVTYKASPDAEHPAVTIDDLLQLDDHDVVYMTTHGGRLCTDKKAPLKPLSGMTSSTVGAYAGGHLSTLGQGGAPGDCRTDFLLQRFHGTATDLRAIDHPGVVLYQGSRYRSIAVTADFFRHHYPAGLGDTLFVLLSCSTFADDFTPHLLGGGTVYVSWDGMVDADHAQATAALMEQLLLRGITVAQAMAEIGDDGFDPVHGGRLRVAGEAAGMRIRDPMTVFDGFSGEELPALQDIAVVGTPGDGQNDSLLLHADLLGLLDENLADTRVRVTVDGAERLAGTVAQLGERGNDTQVRLTLEVPLRRDSEAGQRLAIEVRLDLPEGGSVVAAGQPRVIGEENLGQLWEAELVTVIQPFDATLGTARLQARIDFLRAPGQDADEPNPVYGMAGGEYQYGQSGGTIAGECTVSMAASGVMGRKDDTFITFDRSGELTTVSGWGTSGTPSTDAIVRCPIGNFTLTLPTDHVILNIPEALGQRIDGGAFSGSHAETTEMAEVSWTWSFRRVQ